MNRVLGRYSQQIDSSWKMYPVGVLFGLGFDTATEVGLLVLAGSAVVGGLPAYAILALPVLFAAGMCLFDTLDGCFMNFAYDWAFANPVRKVFYNLTITGLSVAIAFFVGTIEILALIAQEANLNSPLWNFVRGFNINTAGYVIVGMFVVTWVAALAYWRIARIEERVVLEPALDRADLAEVPEPITDRVPRGRVELSRPGWTVARYAPTRGASDARTLHLQCNCDAAARARGRPFGVPGHRADRAPASGRARRAPIQLGGCRRRHGGGLTEADLIRTGASGGRVRGCGARTTLDLPILACGRVAGFDVKLVSGEELLVVSIDLVDA